MVDLAGYARSEECFRIYKEGQEIRKRNSVVYFLDIRNLAESQQLDRLSQLFEIAGFKKLIKKDNTVALKLNVGDRGNTTHLKPMYARRIIQKVKECGGKPFLTDTNTLYKGPRSNTLDHLQCAIDQGFDHTMGAPMIIADGLIGKESVEIKVNLKYFKEIKIGAAACHADVIIGLTHFKGHEVTGFGGTLKNIGMGLGTRAGKQMMHADVKPQVNLDLCTSCGECVINCPVQAITIKKGQRARIDLNKCLGCAECIVICPADAIAISWAGTPDSVQEKIAEYVYGALKDKKGKMGFLNFVMDVTPICDCYHDSGVPFVPDIGILASLDPVAIDQASVDLVNQASGIKETALGEKVKSKDKFRVVYPTVDWSVQLSYGERIGLGSRKYELISIT